MDQLHANSFSEPAIDRPHKTGHIGLLIGLSAALISAAVGFALLPAEIAEPLVLALLGLLAVVGIFAAFAGAIGLIKFSGKESGNPLAKSYLDTMSEGVLIADTFGRITYANRAYADLTGAEDGSNVKTVERMLAGDPNATEAIFRLSQASREGRRAHEEVRLAHPLGQMDGEPRWYRVRVRPLTTETRAGTSKTPLAVWQIADITRERDEQESSFQQLQRVINFLDHAPAGFLSADAEGRIMYMNATLADWLGYDLAMFETGAVNLSQVTSGEGDALIRAVRGEPGEVVTRTIDLDFVKRDGQSLPVRLVHRITLAHDGTGRESRTLVLNRSAEEGGADALRSAEVRFARFFNNTPIAIAAVDRDGRIGRTNAPFARLFGGDTDGERRTLFDLVAEDDRQRLLNAMESASAGRSKIPVIDAVLNADNERSARFYVSAVTDDEKDEDAAIVYALETTEQRTLEAQFAQGQKMQAVGQLAGGVAHDFNNVLTAIIGFSDLLLSSHRPTDPSFQDIMNIKQNANRAASLVRQLLAFSRRQTLRPQFLELNDVLAELTILLDRLLGETTELRMIHGRDLWPVKADVNQFEQVIVNLAVNARDALPDGGNLTIETRNIVASECAQFETRGMPDADYVLVEVTDTGTGMSAQIIDKIFEPFFSTKDVGKGTGLGLSTAYGIVKQSGGFIYAYSELGEGTTFRLFLPRQMVQPPETPAKDAKDAEPALTDLTGSATILLVEDEEAVRAFAARALSSRGYTVHEAETGAQALEIMEETAGEIDLVVSDVVMPELDGPSLLRELRKKRPDLKIIFISGYAEEAFKKNLPENETFNFLPKPFSLKQLAMAVKQTLSQ
jgi:two-component system cell cycle sensor histidine kinase/response regulator CckA